MTASTRNPLLPALLSAAGLMSGCLLTRPTLGDQLFESGDLEGARSAYEELLELKDTGRAAERALYNLGLIYFQPDSPLYDVEAGERTLERLTAIEPQSSYATHASLVLGLQAETNRLHKIVDEQIALRKEVQTELAEAQNSATMEEVRSKAREENLANLSSALSRLKGEIATLTEEVAAKEDELERIKAIDLDGPP